MPNARLVINQQGHAPREIEIAGGSKATIGRAPDNVISLPGETDASRYHAIIESRGEDFWVIDLRSSNGTTVNNTLFELDRQLRDGDKIGIGGGASTIEFHLGQGTGTAPAQGGAMDVGFTPQAPLPAAAVPSAPQLNPPAVPEAGGISPVILMASIGGGLLVVALVAGLLLYKFSGGCKATVRIISPQSGVTLRGPLPVRVEAEGTKCIDRVIYQLDGEKIVSSEVPPYEVVLDPQKLPELKGENHILSVTVEDDAGNKTLQAETVLLAFNNGKKETISDSALNSDAQTGQTTQSNQLGAASTSTVSVFDIKDLVGKLSKRISNKNDYVFDHDFLEQVRIRTNDYASAGYFERARNYRDVINDSFVGEQGLDAPLGYVMAMSRSRFALNQTRSASGAAATSNATTSATSASEPAQGLWMIQPALAQSTGYIGRCGTSTLADGDQKCSAMVASMYVKFLDVDLFSGDYLYAVASFGLPPNEAAQFRDQLPPDRRDFWKVLKSPQQRDSVVRFFAAGIVAENPQRFGLNQDKPLSNLYPKK
jgi:hypothetical protein